MNSTTEVSITVKRGDRVLTFTSVYNADDLLSDSQVVAEVLNLADAVGDQFRPRD